MSKSKSFREQLREHAREFALVHGAEYEIADLVKWALENKKYELSREDIFKRATRDYTAALREAKDDDGIRTFIDAQVRQQRLWSHRMEASWPLRQQFITEQCKRSDDFQAAVVKQCETFNRERKDGEPEFQLTFGLDDGKEAV